MSSNNIMTLGMLKARLAELENSGIINDDTKVCTFADEFQCLCPVNSINKIIVSTSEIAKELDDIAEYYDKNKPDDIKQNIINKKRNEAAFVRSLGEYVICVGGYC